MAAAGRDGGGRGRRHAIGAADRSRIRRMTMRFLLPLVLAAARRGVQHARRRLRRRRRLDARLHRHLPGRGTHGRFAEFSATLRFDPVAPAACTLRRAHRPGQRRHRNTERDEMLHGNGFFNVGKAARGTLRRQPLPRPGRQPLRRRGQCSRCSGISKPVPLTFTWSRGTRPVLVGERGRLKSASTSAWAPAGGPTWRPATCRTKCGWSQARLLLAAPAGTPAAKQP